ncbi:S-adenosyl-L-methionine-dependent methyltransferase [Gaertneriomyces semiglobifer]|nr:S-adenosyl-L-methionine-dependent methyltransferase [Gaertneriomyces semiglobifer]
MRTLRIPSLRAGHGAWKQPARSSHVACSRSHTYSTSSETPADATASSSVQKEPLTPIARILRSEIKATGPISTYNYMRMALGHPTEGYYMKQDVFGKEGDFTTSPEISQVFGELIAVWFITQWEGMGRPKAIQLIELGPGRGTLMSDILRTLQQFPFLKSVIQTVHFVETSPYLRDKQSRTIAGPDVQVSKVEDYDLWTAKTPHGTEVQWHTSLEDVPNELPTFYIAHEFFDAMPVYKFQMTEHGWREIMIGVDESLESPHHFLFSLAPAETKASKIIPRGFLTPTEKPYQIGDKVELAPDVHKVASIISRRMQSAPGMALYIDYGGSTTPSDTFRAIRKHAYVPPLSSPGLNDLTCDVSFPLVASASKSDKTFAHGPITQSTFLRAMGIGPRMQILMQTAMRDKLGMDKVKDLAKAYDRLVGERDEGMGNIYKFMCVTNSADAPYPFGKEGQEVAEVEKDRVSTTPKE